MEKNYPITPLKGSTFEKMALLLYFLLYTILAVIRVSAERRRAGD